MKPGKSNSTGHYIILKPKKDEPKDFENHWSEKRRRFYRRRRTYAYCRDCKQYGWGWAAICPMNCRIVTHQEIVAA